MVGLFQGCLDTQLFDVFQRLPSNCIPTGLVSRVDCLLKKQNFGTSHCHVSGRGTSTWATTYNDDIESGTIIGDGPRIYW